MKITNLGWLILVCTVLGVNTKTYAAPSDATLTLVDCFVPKIKSKAKCGTLDVAEDRSKPMSETNKVVLNIVLLPKFKEESKEYPLMFLAGGPGQAATELAPAIDRFLSDTRQQHDILFIDQRGTGKSNPLSCDDDLIDALALDDSAISIQKDVEKCLKEMPPRHLPSYNTYDSIKDFEAVREALGFDKVHLLGGSYGTRAGFAYLKLFPQSIETAILDSNAPMELVIGMFGKTSERAFDMLLADCSTNEKCQTAFPNLKQDYLSLVAQLDKGPIKHKTFHPATGKPVEAILSKNKVTEAMRSTLYDLGSRQMLPYMINRAANGDLRFLTAFIGRTVDSERSAGGMYPGLTMNILCNEDIPRGKTEAFDADADNYFNGKLGHSNFTDVCQYWPKWPAPVDFAEPVTADVPVLLFSGSYDPVTPPAYGEMALKNLPNAKHVEIKNGAHVASIRQCTSLISAFISVGKFDDLDYSCADKSVPMMFFTDMNQLH
ncbi:alpha/beta fold hydrolase [Psychrosphaera sp. 1_MG-2023]|uniref:alpha/beta fold hydrolase n=1 Tax=Psychrosphaera sp. 1_MG-2023 TaxID=3062643 RepID=UPI0026E14770|nr:alpha/beta fold hydrolase [Psychrosphaera sp. 1_MG-2023]MDO6718525.1 alpha/beta fold hydrolase [Psychrosphaera sp. 1_MG-2023]